MPAEKSVREQAKGFFGNLLKKKGKNLEQGTTSKDTAESQVDELERSLTKDDPLLENNTFNGDEEDVRKNSKNKKREEDKNGSNDEGNKENRSSENVKADNTDKDKEDKEHPEIREEPVVSAPPKKKKWKRFRLTKKQEESLVTEDETEQPEQLDSHQETSFVSKEADKDMTAAKEEVEEEQPSTSRLSDEEEPTPAPRPVPRRRKFQNPQKRDVLQVDDPEEPPRLSRRRRRRKASRKAPEPEEGVAEEPSALSVGEESMDEEREETPPEDDQVLGVTVHHSDHLRADLKYMSHPVVRVSVVDPTTGNYLTKTNRSRRVTSYYESEDVTSVLPIMTQPFDFRANQSVLPRWEETLVFNESFASMVERRNLQLPACTSDPEAPPIEMNMPAPSPMLFFVIRDFVSMAKANNMRSGIDDVDKGWLTVAWAFLKLVGANGKPNTGRKVRLQLYHPPRNQATVPADTAGQSEPAFFWWRDHLRQTYQSTLYVTLKAVLSPEAMNPACRSMFATQPECGIQTFKQLHQTLEFADGSKRANSDQSAPKWSRIPGQTCKIPNIVSLRLWAGADGAFTIRFSNKGRRLAVACKHGTGYPILLYGIPYGEEMGVLLGHQQLVYDIQWSNDDERVVTSSGDGTAQVWDLNDKSKATHTLPHPAYVYTGAFHPTAQHIVATGGYDSVVRVWSISTPTAQMLQELDAHKAFVNSLAFDHSGLTLYSVDSGGLIVAWNCHSHEKPRKVQKTVWSLKSKFVEKDLTGVCINNVQVHPGNNKLLLHCRDSIVRIFDVRIHSLLNCTGSINHRQFMRSALTPCGSFIFSGSEDGCAYVWNAESGDQVAIYNELGFARPVRDITYHPLDHLVAFCCFSPNMPVLLFKYDRDATSLTGGIISVVGSSVQRPAKNDSELARPEAATSYTGSKVDRIKRQLDAVLPEGEPDRVENWFAARKMVTISMAARAFADGTKSRGTPMSSPRRPTSPPGAEYITPQRQESYGASNTLSTWGSTFDTRSQSIIQPSFMSPHASPEARFVAQHLAAGQPKPDAQAGWKPTFTAVGGSPYRSDVSAGPDVSLLVDDAGNRSVRVSSAPGVKVHHKVVALYGYYANRSDELTFMRGDVIKVLYMDGPTWWFGEKEVDRQQGYFPTNYVAVQDGQEVQPDESPDVLFGALPERPDSSQSEPPKTVHALKMGSKVHFYSQSESEEDDLRNRASRANSSRQRRRERRDEDNPAPPIPVVKSRNVSFTSPVVKTLSRPSKREVTDAPRKLPTLLSDNEKIEETVATVTEATTTVVEPTPKPRKSKPKSQDVAKRSTVTSQQQRGEDATRADTSRVAKETSSDSILPQPATSRQHFGVLKAVQARMAEQPSFSDSVVVGPEFPGRPARLAALGPVMTSTASKPKRSKSRSNRSSTRGRNPTLLVTAPTQDDVIPMMDLGSDIRDEGVSNPAYDDVSEV